MGKGDTTANYSVYIDLLCSDDRFRSKRRRSGRRLCDGRFGSDLFGSDCGDDFLVSRDEPLEVGIWIHNGCIFYTTIANIIERPDGIKIASLFIFGIILASFVSRAMRSTEIRIDSIELDEKAQQFIDELNEEGEIRIVTNRREAGDVTEYRFKEHEKRVDNHIPATDPIIFFEVDTGDASEFKGRLKIRGIEINGYRVLRTEAPAVPNAIAAFLLYLRDRTGKIPHVYFGWSEGNPIMYLARYILLGEGDTAPVTREILRQAEPDPELRPNVHVGG